MRKLWWILSLDWFCSGWIMLPGRLYEVYWVCGAGLAYFFSFLFFLTFSFFLSFFLKGKKLLWEKSPSALCVCMKPKQAVCEHEVNYCKTVQLMIFHSKTKNIRQWRPFLEDVITAVFGRVFIGCRFIPYRLLHKIHCKKTVANQTRCFRVVLYQLVGWSSLSRFEIVVHITTRAVILST